MPRKLQDVIDGLPESRRDAIVNRRDAILQEIETRPTPPAPDPKDAA